jgi:hypothetical protein
VNNSALATVPPEVTVLQGASMVSFPTQRRNRELLRRDRKEKRKG